MEKKIFENKHKSGGLKDAANGYSHRICNTPFFHSRGRSRTARTTTPLVLLVLLLNLTSLHSVAVKTSSTSGRQIDLYALKEIEKARGRETMDNVWPPLESPDTRQISPESETTVTDSITERTVSSQTYTADETVERSATEEIEILEELSLSFKEIFKGKHWIGDLEEILEARGLTMRQFLYLQRVEQRKLEESEAGGEHRALARSRSQGDGVHNCDGPGLCPGAGKGTTWLFDDDHTNHFFDYYKPEGSEEDLRQAHDCQRIVKKLYKRDKVVRGTDAIQCMGCRRGDSGNRGDEFDTGDTWIQAKEKCPKNCQKHIGTLYETCGGVSLPPGFYWDAQLTQNGPWDEALMNWLRIEIALCGCNGAQSNRGSVVFSALLLSVLLIYLTSQQGHMAFLELRT